MRLLHGSGGSGGYGGCGVDAVACAASYRDEIVVDHHLVDLVERLADLRRAVARFAHTFTTTRHA